MSRTGLALLMMGVFVVLALAMLPAPLPGAESRNFTQFDAVIANAGSNQAKEPLLEFSEYREGCDPSIRSANLDYIKNNQELIGRIRSDLGNSPLTWMLE